MRGAGVLRRLKGFRSVYLAVGLAAATGAGARRGLRDLSGSRPNPRFRLRERAAVHRARA